VFISKFVQSILDYKIKQSQWVSTLMTCIHLAYLITIFLTRKRLAVGIFFALTFTQETMQFVRGAQRVGFVNVFIDHFTDIWNLMDLMVMIIQVVYLFYGPSHAIIFAWLTLISWFQGLKFFRAFKSTRVFIQLLVTSFYSVRQFLVVLIMVVLGFTQAFFIAQADEGDNALNKWSVWGVTLRTQFLATVQDPENDWFEEEDTWAFYIVRTIIILVIMMTLLIAVVVSNYEGVARSMDQQQYRQMCEIIIEQETFIFWNKSQNGLGKDKNLIYAEK